MMLEKDEVRLGFSTGETVGPITPEQAFNALPESLKDKNKIIEVGGESYVIPKNRNADDVRNLNTDIITPTNFLEDVQRKMEKIIEKDKRINSKVTKASNVAYDVLTTISAALNPMLDQSDVARPDEKLSEKEKEMLEDYNKRNTKNMGGLLENDETRMSYATGEDVVDPMQEAINNLKNFLNEKEIKDVQNNTIASPIVRKYINRVEEQGAEPEAVFNMFNAVAKKEEPKVQKAEGGSIDDQMMMVMTPPIESEMDSEMSMESDGEMEDGYTRFIMEEALTEDEEDMLMSKLEQDEELSMLFDKIIDVAQEFAGSGPVNGPGSGVSDSIPARLSDGEFVFTAKAVEEIGEDTLMSMMKDAEAAADKRQGFAEGELVEEETVTMPVERQPVEQNIRVTKETVGPQAGMLEQDDLVDSEVKKSMFRQNRFL
jgi:hypothetical protein